MLLSLGENTFWNLLVIGCFCFLLCSYQEEKLMAEKSQFSLQNMDPTQKECKLIGFILFWYYLIVLHYQNGKTLA